MIKKVLCINPNSSQYQALYYFTKKIHAAFLRLGYDCRLLDNDEHIIHHISDDPPDLLFCFNGALFVSPELFLCDIIKIPQISCLVDHPFAFAKLFKSPYVIVTSDDQASTKILHEHMFPPTVFMPHAVERELAPVPNSERIYDVVLLASYINFQGIKEFWKKNYPFWVCLALDDAIDLTLSDEQTTFVDAFRNAINKRIKLRSPNEKNDINLLEIFGQLELYIKGRERYDMLNAIEDAEVHIFGNADHASNWKGLLPHKKNLHYHDAVSYEESLKIMQQSKIVLNCGLKNKFGAHERIFAGLACEALVITHANPYLRTQFQEDKEICFYQYSQISQLNQKIKFYLENDAKREQVAKAGRLNVMAHHTWDHRIQQLMKDIAPYLEKIAQLKNEEKE